MSDTPLYHQYIIAIIPAIALGTVPFVTLWLQKALDNSRQARERKLGIFKTLMATRRTPISPFRIEALSMIDIEFYGNDPGEKKVVDAWDICREALSRHVSQEKLDDHFTDLLAAMAEYLGFKFRRADLSRTYYPEGLQDEELESRLLRKKLLHALATGVLMVGDPSDYQKDYKEFYDFLKDTGKPLSGNVLKASLMEESKTNIGMTKPVTDSEITPAETIQPLSEESKAL